jgi:hypothetical protein
MRRSALGHRIVKGSYSCAFPVSLALLGAVAVFGQHIPRRGSTQPDADGPYPRLPGAVVTAPDWIGADAPFDVARFFDAVPRDRNAAPLYLDALFEFGTNVAICFPEGPERDRRSQAAEDRMKRWLELDKALRNDPKGVPAELIDAVIALHETGFRKLAEAQRRDRCVFDTGLGDEAQVPHIQDARQVARVALLRVRRAVERQDFDAAIRDVETVLRLARDLQPRGCMVGQLVAVAITHVVCIDMLSAILADPGLRIEHCDHLLKVFLSHEASFSDGYAEGLRAEYLTALASLQDIVRKQPPGVVQPSADDRARFVRNLNDYYRTLLGLDGVPYAQRLDRIAMTAPGVVEVFSRATGRVTATLHAAECLIVMRRWQLTHRGLPRALLVPAREAGLKAIPTDPYDGNPMRVGALEGQPVVYSIGKDGHDDGAQQDSKFDTQPGDLIYRMPPVQARR